jgi:hypothetical protein
MATATKQTEKQIDWQFPNEKARNPEHIQSIVKL